MAAPGPATSQIPAMFLCYDVVPGIVGHSRKVEGEPLAPHPADAHREQYLAWVLAQKARVRRVWLGDAAVRLLYPSGRRPEQQDVDVIAETEDKHVILGEAKGEHFGKAIVEQLPAACRRLQSLGYRVEGGLVLAVVPRQAVVSVVQANGVATWRIIGDPDRSDGTPWERCHPPCSRKHVYLVEQELQRLHVPSGFAVRPGERRPLLETHLHAPRTDDRGHMTSATWSWLHPYIIPGTANARVHMLFVSA